MAIAFLPIDIDVKLPNEEKIIQYCHDNHLKLAGFSRNFEFVPVISRLTDEEWNHKSNINTALNQRYYESERKLIYYRDIDKVFPEISYMLKQLPFKEITFASLLLQKEQVPYHMDTGVGDVIKDFYEISIENEPHRYNIQLTKHNINRFFVSEEFNGKKNYANIPQERPCFAFTERYYWHGVDYVEKNCVHLAVMGITDHVKHKDMIIKNLIKYYDEAIIYPDPIDPWNPKFQTQYDDDGNDLYYG